MGGPHLRAQPRGRQRQAVRGVRIAAELRPGREGELVGTDDRACEVQPVEDIER